MKKIIVFTLIIWSLKGVELELIGDIYGDGVSNTSSVYLHTGDIFVNQSGWYGSIYLKTLYSTNELLRQFIISDASVGYAGDDSIITLGRMEVEYDWLSGSVDMLSYSYEFESGTIQTFYGLQYTDLTLYTYIPTKSFESSIGIFGIIYKQELFNLYNYTIPTFRNQFGIHSQLNEFMFDFSYLQALVNEPIQGDEWYIRAQYTHAIDNLELSIGLHHNGENGMIKFYDYGVGNYGDFYLGNNNYWGDITNYFGKLQFSLSPIDIYILAGSSQSDTIHSYEADIFGSLQLTKGLSLEAGYYMMYETTSEYQFELALRYNYD